MSSSKAKDNTGLGGAGTNAFYPPATRKRGAKAEAPPESQPEARPKAAKSDKMRTTIMLSPDTVAGIETLRAQARRDGSRLTTSQIIEDALLSLLRARKINI